MVKVLVQHVKQPKTTTPTKNSSTHENVKFPGSEKNHFNENDKPEKIEYAGNEHFRVYFVHTPKKKKNLVHASIVHLNHQIGKEQVNKQWNGIPFD